LRAAVPDIDLAAFTSDLSPAARALRWSAFRELLHGRASTPAGLAPAAGLSEQQAGALAHALAARGLVVLDGQRIVGALGLSLSPTRHRIEFDRGTGTGVWHTWCAYDAVGIPAALGLDATAVTSCPACATPLRVSLRGGQVPPGTATVGWWPDRSACTNVVEQFCPDANLFCFAEHLDRWRRARADPAGQMLSLVDLARIGRRNWAPAELGADVTGRRRNWAPVAPPDAEPDPAR
jgi:alkylmercury lyase